VAQRLGVPAIPLDNQIARGPWPFATVTSQLCEVDSQLAKINYRYVAVNRGDGFTA